MKKLLIILFCMQACLAYSQERVGTYNPDRDEREKSRGTVEQWFRDTSEKADALLEDNVKKWVNSIPYAYRIPLAYVKYTVYLLLLYLLYAKVIFRRKRENGDLSKIIQRTRFLVILLMVLWSLAMLHKSLIWAALFVVTAFIIYHFLYLNMFDRLCPYCCRCVEQTEEKVMIGERRVEVYSKSGPSQYLTREEITEKTFPSGEYEVYVVEKCQINHRCVECGGEWSDEGWERIGKL